MKNLNYFRGDSMVFTTFYRTGFLKESCDLEDSTPVYFVERLRFYFPNPKCLVVFRREQKVLIRQNSLF